MIQLVNCLCKALSRPCEQRVTMNIKWQVERPSDVGFPQGIICLCLGRSHKSGKIWWKEASRRACLPREAPSCWLCHMGANCRTIKEKKYGGKMRHPSANLAPEKLAWCRLAVNDTKKKGITCKAGVVYKVSLSCGKSYIGKTGRCLNDKQKENCAQVRALAGSGHLADHCQRFEFTTVYDSTHVLGKFKVPKWRVTYTRPSAYNNVDNCISTRSVGISNEEIDCLNK